MNTTLACAGKIWPVPVHFSVAVVQLLGLSRQACRWPIGDPRSLGFTFCGDPRTMRSSYCAAHRRLACEVAG